MLVFLDTNILISAALNPLSTPGEAFDKAVTSPNRAVICQQNVEELRRIFEMKLPAKMRLLDGFLLTIESSSEVVPVPDVESTSEADIRDAADRPILRAAIACGADVLVTGDKDFLEANVHVPRIITARTFVQM